MKNLPHHHSILFLLLSLPLFWMFYLPAPGEPVLPEMGIFHPGVSGPYMGQGSPEQHPELFAPGIVSTGMFSRDMAISPNGKEIFYCVILGNYRHATILQTREVNGVWTEPEIASFSGGPGVLDLEPAFSPDGNRLYFLSNRSDGQGEEENQDIWYVEKKGDHWGEAVNLGAPVNTPGDEFFPSMTSDGTLYFTRNDPGTQLSRIYRSRYYGGAFQEPELLPDQVNCGSNRFNAFISPGEDYILVPVMGQEDAFDAVDYCVVFRDSLDRWSIPLNLGPEVNQGNTRGWSPYVSPDGKAFFFMANFLPVLTEDQWNYEHLLGLHRSPRNGNPQIWWMDASFLEDLRKKAMFL